jgi:hypothetical protein
MSFYRSLGSIVLNSVQPIEDQGGAGTMPAPTIPSRPIDSLAMRRAAPECELLEITIAWYSELPPDVQPKALVAKYPRIANALCATWREPQAFKDLMDELLIDRRGSRKGFPAVVLRDLLALRMHFHSVYPNNFNAWQTPLKW